MSNDFELPILHDIICVIKYNIVLIYIIDLKNIGHRCFFLIIIANFYIEFAKKSSFRAQNSYLNIIVLFWVTVTDQS